MQSKMPKIKTLRSHFPDCKLSDVEMIKLSEWLRDYLKVEHISVNNKILKALIDWENDKLVQ